VRGIIFAGGEAPEIEFIKSFVKDKDYIICLDKGLEYADAAEVEPSVILGDFDSVSGEILEKYKAKGVLINKFPAQKDFTDMELGISEAIRAGVGEIVLLAAFGGRVDHMLGNIDNMVQALKNGISIAIYDEKQHLYLLDCGRSFNYKKGTIISLLPFSGEVKGVTTQNLSYPLKNETLTKGCSRGVSNIFLEDMAKIDFISGILQVIVNI